MFGIGASVLASISMSKREIGEADKTITQAFAVGTSFMASIVVLCCCFAENVVDFLGCSQTLKSQCLDYLYWLLPGIVFIMFQFIGMMLIRLDGSPKYAMSVQIVSALLNIVLAYVMVFPLGMGIAGASIATSISCAE